MKSNKRKNIGLKVLIALPLAFLYGLWLYFFSPDNLTQNIVAVICIALNGIFGILLDKYYIKN